MFIDQLTKTLEAEQAEQADENEISLRISGPSGVDGSKLSEMGLNAAADSKALLRLGCNVGPIGERLWRPVPSHHELGLVAGRAFQHRRIPNPEPLSRQCHCHCRCRDKIKFC